MLQLVFMCSAVQFVIDFSFVSMCTCISVGATGMQVPGEGERVL